MANNKKLNVFLPLLFSLALALGMLLGFKLRDEAGYKSTIFLHPFGNGAVQEILNLVDVKYVDSVNTRELRKDAIQGILDHLDPHSVYIPSSQLASVNEDLEGNFPGIGVEFNIFSDTVNVTSVVPSGPSEGAGLQTGDKIIRVNDSLVAGNHITADRIRKLLRGPEGTRVNVTIFRNSKLLPFSIKRGIIPLYSIDASYMLTNGIGYIKINRFAASTYDEFMKALLSLQKKGMKKLILDLRQNPGGYLDAATKIADELLDDNKLVVSTQGKSYPKTAYKCEKPGIFESGSLCMLVDEGTASAAEILSGAVQDWDRGVIIGRRTFGKGLVQEQFPLNDGGALRLTIARYYMPSGRCIQKPYDHGIEAYDQDIMNRFHHGEFLHKDSVHLADTVKYFTLLKHRPVYGGEGITPDIFIPFDTTSLDGVQAALFRQNTFYDFTYEYYVHHKNDFSRYSSPEDFNTRFSISDQLLQDFRRFALQDSVANIGRMTPKDEVEIKNRMKSLFARQLWRTEGYYRVSNSYDPMMEKAIEVLNNDKEYEALR